MPSAARLATAVGLILLLTLFASAIYLQPSGKEAEPQAPGAVDIGFAQFMSLHHQQAIGMAQMMLDGEPTRLEMLAKTVAYTQLLELGEMQGWLRLWDQPLQPRSRSMTWMLMGRSAPGEEFKQYLLDCENSPTGMPGLATMAQLEELRRLQGRQRDQRFLQLMLEHHKGGIPMAQFAARNAHVKVVRDLAKRVVVEQTEEVSRIQRTLAAMAQSAAE